jgi:hypothetical protein
MVPRARLSESICSRSNCCDLQRFALATSFSWLLCMCDSEQENSATFGHVGSAGLGSRAFPLD